MSAFAIQVDVLGVRAPASVPPHVGARLVELGDGGVERAGLPAALAADPLHDLDEHKGPLLLCRACKF